MKERIRKLITHHVLLITNKTSFTLVEIAIVLVIIGLLVGLGAGLMGPLTKRAKYNETKETMSAAIESVISFAAANNRVPTTSEFPTAVRNPRDAWTKDLYYIPDADLDDLNAGGICGRKTTNLTVCRDAACTVSTNISNVVFIVISGAENYNIQSGTITGAPCPAGQTCVRVYDVDTPGIDDYATDMNRPESYDDIVKWITLDELRIKAGCTGTQLKILNNEMPAGFQNSAYNAVISADGGVPFSLGGKYRWCRQESTSTGLTFNPPALNANCSGLAEASWGQADNITISGTPTLSGNFNFIFFVRDNNDPSGANDNITQKAFVLTISPPSWVIVRNTTGAAAYYRVNGVLPCNTLNNNATFSAGFTETITFFTTSARCTNNMISCTNNYSALMGLDANRNGRIMLSAIIDTSCTLADE